MTQPPTAPRSTRTAPRFRTSANGVVSIVTDGPEQLRELFGTKTGEAASGLMRTAMNALGRSGEDYRDLLAAMAVEIEPRDGIEAMLVVQMAATHTAMAEMARRMMDTTGGYQVRESLERSMTRLSRTYLAQIEALKKHRAKAQQTVRVERVTVENGGQAVVGNIQHGGRPHVEE
ncbi:hypothetical protein [Limimaricola pyoseonensis]|uniref:Phasin protein n=1 Tax=Limimaricola pyoseonensis TaxID=521013 RepID=A0A1G7D7J2_9RHOB|nr:hypothetical protein [Limimaricola pyoseonensis]SDE47503.1 hypothetical protein SAMN04488567_1820 [Limimaricola pyoseonensis]